LIRSLFLQVGQAIPSSPMELITSSSGSTKFVLAILVILSLVSWGIIFAKWYELRRAARITYSFAHEFAGAHTVEAAARMARVSNGPPATITERAMRFIQETTPALHGTPERTARFSGSQVEALRLVLDAETTSERDRLSRWVPSLATIGSVSPLIGLLGTVLGVIDAFVGIASKGSGNIGAVAPGVAEALIATACGLAIAIISLFPYNDLNARAEQAKQDVADVSHALEIPTKKSESGSLSR